MKSVYNLYINIKSFQKSFIPFLHPLSEQIFKTIVDTNLTKLIDHFILQ